MLLVLRLILCVVRYLWIKCWIICEGVMFCVVYSSLRVFFLLGLIKMVRCVVFCFIIGFYVNSIIIVSKFDVK